MHRPPYATTWPVAPVPPPPPPPPPPPLPLPVLVWAAPYWTLIVPAELVEPVGVVQLQTPFGNPPPMARSKMMDRLWSKAACHVAVPTWLSVTEKYWLPSR